MCHVYVEEMLSQQLLWIVSHSDESQAQTLGRLPAGGAGAGAGALEIHDLQKRIEVVGKELSPVQQHFKAAEFEYSEARDELEDAVQRKRCAIMTLASQRH